MEKNKSKKQKENRGVEIQWYMYGVPIGPFANV